MIVSVLLILLGIPFQAEVPFKPNEEFQLEIDYKFKVRSGHNDSNTRVDYSTNDVEPKTGGGPLPYLIINFKALKLSGEEVRVKVVNNLGKLALSKKVEEGEVFKLDLGFTDDMKDRVTPHEFIVYFMNAKKEELSKVQLLVQDDGTFLVNKEKRGKF